MTPSRFQRTSAELLAATLVASSSAIEFGDDNGATQSTGTVLTVAPGSETQTSTASSGESSFGNTDEWMQTESSSKNLPNTATSGSQGWTTSTDTPSVWTPTSGQASGSTSQDWIPPSAADASNGWAPSSAQGSNQGDYSLECSGSDEDTPSVSTSTAGSSNVTPHDDHTAVGTGEQSQPSSLASSSNTATLGGTGENEDALQTSSAATSSTSSGTIDQGTQT